eukprot:scaffold67421_cov61-Phaeocystis_antarctica.AAC.3
MAGWQGAAWPSDSFVGSFSFVLPLLIAYRLYRAFTFTSKISSHPFSPGRRGGATAQSALEAGTDPVLVSQIDVRRYRTLLVVYLV